MKQTKDLQAPIEVSTYDEIKQILESGEYIISCKYYQIFHSTEEVISLKFKSCTGKDKTYTISDLKDLESKIVLIRDHRSNDQDSNTNSKDPQTDSSSSIDNLFSKQIEDFLSVRN